MLIAAGLCASAPSPYTVSVGNPTITFTATAETNFRTATKAVLFGVPGTRGLLVRHGRLRGEGVRAQARASAIRASSTDMENGLVT